MSSPAANSLRQRASGKIDKKQRPTTPNPDDSHLNGNSKVENIKQEAKKAVTREWDYKLAVTVITISAFVTRFWGISHPDQVVFDEVHFGKVSWTCGFVLGRVIRC